MIPAQPGATLVVVGTLRLGADFSLALLAASAGALYYWWAAPLIVKTLQLPPAAAWPWVIASVVIHLFYFIGLSEAYQAGDLGQVYPLARGSAPL